MYFSEQFSPLGENMMTGEKEKLKLGLRIPYLFEQAPNLELAPTSNKRPS